MENRELRRLAAQKPTLEWEEQRRDGDEAFTKASIAEANEILDEFLADVDGLDGAAPREQALPILERAVRGFNALNERHGPVVETWERDQLVTFFFDAFDAVGIVFGPADDPTLRWRHW